MRINNNLMAMNTHRQLGINSGAGAKSIEKLSSGFRINRAGDDAAGLAISEKMRGQIRGLNQASRNAQDGISLIQTAEGALNETHAILQRMRELAVQSATDTNTDADRGELQKEMDQLTTEITRISTDTEFNTKALLNGSFGIQHAVAPATVGTLVPTVNGITSMSDINISGAKADMTYTIAQVTGTTMSISDEDGNAQTIDISAFQAGGTLNFDALGISIKTDADFDNTANDFDGLTIETGASLGAKFHIGANATQNLSLSIGDMGAAGLGVDGIKIDTQAAADAAITTVNTALESVSAERAKLGAVQNRLEHTIKNLDTSSENLQASESRIRDVDMAKEMMNFTKNNILQQAAQAMLAQANQAPQGVLQLLR